MPAVALTDRANIYGAVKFYKAAVKAGVKPIIGVDVWVEQEHNLNNPSRLTLLTKTQHGSRTPCVRPARAHRRLVGRQADQPDPGRRARDHRVIRARPGRPRRRQAKQRTNNQANVVLNRANRHD